MFQQTFISLNDYLQIFSVRTSTLDSVIDDIASLILSQNCNEQVSYVTPGQAARFTVDIFKIFINCITKSDVLFISFNSFNQLFSEVSTRKVYLVFLLYILGDSTQFLHLRKGSVSLYIFIFEQFKKNYLGSACPNLVFV